MGTVSDPPPPPPPPRSPRPKKPKRDRVNCFSCGIWCSLLCLTECGVGKDDVMKAGEGGGGLLLCVPLTKSLSQVGSKGCRFIWNHT